ncbi:GHKL domain-containing protein [Tissierella sp. MB52-C2]|uniref:sensor histidine kinase n=1 Tax=Tissierella sp. MB52-C2 TaxID=3070999 RepID=UPI00280C1084|nr:GHKL domain-containing protein [Tissierella sp. MB52-C2]WMM24597.1 GHKL domain-containing protein [Tissierella sp. MB52-C2]
MEKSNIILSLLFAIVDNMLFVGILSRFRNSKNNYKIIDFLLIIIVSIVTCIFAQFGITPYLKLILISILLFFITFLYDIKLHQRILSVVIYYFILIISELLITSLASEVLGKTAIELNFPYAYFYLGLFSKFLSILLFMLISNKFLNKSIVLPKVLNYLMIGVLSLSSISMILLFYSSLGLSPKGIAFTLFIICLFTLFTSLGTMIMYFKANTFYINLQKETTKRIYNRSYEKFIINSELKNDTLSKIWHDIGNHIKILEKMDIVENKAYINSIKERFKSIPNKISTGNKLIDIILNDKYTEATIHKIDLDIKAISPPNLDIDDMDLSSILFNTIDNAIEACLNCNEKNRYIYLELYLDGNFLFYKIKNSYNSIKDNSSKKFYFNKKKYLSSGYGISIIADISNKYDGYMDIKKDDNEYSLTIILPLNDHPIQEMTT